MLVALMDKKSSTMTVTVEFLVLMLSVLTRVNGQWGYENNEEAAMQEGDRCQIKTGEPGICRRLTSCEVYYEGLKQKTVKYSFLVRCSFIDAEEVICCPNEDTQSSTGSRVLRVTTAKPTTKKTTTTTTTTTMQPILVGDKTITGDEPFIDLSKIFSTTTKRPRQTIVVSQEPPLNINTRPIPPSNLNTGGVQNPWIGNGNINNNNNQWLDQRVPQNQERTLTQQNNVRFPTASNVFPTVPTNVNFPGQMTLTLPQPLPTDSSLKTEAFITEENNIFKQYEFRGPDDSNAKENSEKSLSLRDVEVFNTINTNRVPSSKLVQFPGQMTVISPPPSVPTNSLPIKTIAKQNNPFEQYEFRGSDNSNVNGNNGKTEPTIWKSPQVVPMDSNVEVFNTIDTNSDKSNKLIQFPGQMMVASPPQPFFPTNSFPKTDKIIIKQNDNFDTKFRPGFNDLNVMGGNSGTVIGWSTPNPERTTDRTTKRRTTTTTTTTSTTESTILTNWMKESLDQVAALTTRPPPAPLPLPPVTATSSVVTPTPPVDTVTTRDTGVGSGRPSQVACQRYREVNPAGLTFHILDGVPVEPGAFPHIGGLIFPQGGGNEVDNRCGSSLISERYVLTAAHCVNDPLSLPTFVRFGVVVWNSKDEDYPPIDVEIENITLHPEYRSHLRYHDLALIRLRNNIDFSTLVRPACLNSDLQDIDSSVPLVVIGWGVTNVQTRARSEVLLMTNVTTVALQECNATHIAYGTSRAYRSGLNEGHYCAFDPELKKDACQADSGGPLQLVRNKQSTLIGVVSFGLSCGSAVPSVYVRIAYYLDWIESIVWPS